MDRRTTIKWVMAAASLSRVVPGRAFATPPTPAGQPYGTDPKLLTTHVPGGLWPLTFADEQRRTAAALCDAIIPADENSPSASAVGVVQFIDEWVSAPYAMQAEDRVLVLDGLQWLDAESARRYRRRFDQLTAPQIRSLCDPISNVSVASKRLSSAARFFARFRDLTAGGYYTSPAGRADLQYVGNTPSISFEGPPLEVLKQVGLA